MIVEADDAVRLARGMQGLAVRMARRLNRMMDRRGDVFADRYHAHALRSPTEVARAVAYVLGNFLIHAARRGEAVASGIDPFCSAAQNEEDVPLTARPQTWLLCIGWARATR
jgi:REP-associated tyrosine transposase